MELLAPAGNMEKMKMALLYGADAVYLAGKAFGLRAYGGNFTREEMKEAVEYAHSMGKKVYITVNIIPRNEDLEGLDTYLKYLQDIHADAVLISDLGVFDIARFTGPCEHAGERGKLAHRQEMERYGRVPCRSCQRSIPFGNGGHQKTGGYRTGSIRPWGALYFLERPLSFIQLFYKRETPVQPG